MTKHSLPVYVLVTPARNEDAFIERTIRSVVNQTFLPERWVIVSDGSTDRTDEIVQRYADSRGWMTLIRRPVHHDRHFASKVQSFEAGYRRLADLKFEIIGNLDADLSFEKDYMEYLLLQFSQDADLGVAGTPFTEDSAVPYDYRFTNIEHVSGACQLFRRTCFESIGGYRPIRGGGIDWVAVTMARMKGWKTRTFTEKCLHHYRKMGTGNNSRLRTHFSLGRQDYYLGNHPLWEVFRAAYQMSRKPHIVGGLILLSGYLSSAMRRQERQVPAELVAFVRQEQMDRLRQKVGLAEASSA